MGNISVCCKSAAFAIMYFVHYISGLVYVISSDLFGHLLSDM